MDIIAMLSNGFLAVAKVFGFAQQREAEKNAPDVKAAAVAKQEQQVVDNINKQTGKDDINADRNEIAE